MTGPRRGLAAQKRWCDDDGRYAPRPGGGGGKQGERLANLDGQVWVDGVERRLAVLAEGQVVIANERYVLRDAQPRAAQKVDQFDAPRVRPGDDAGGGVLPREVDADRLRVSAPVGEQRRADDPARLHYPRF